MPLNIWALRMGIISALLSLCSFDLAQPSILMDKGLGLLVALKTLRSKDHGREDLVHRIHSGTQWRQLDGCVRIQLPIKRSFNLQRRARPRILIILYRRLRSLGLLIPRQHRARRRIYLHIKIIKIHRYCLLNLHRLP